MTVALFDLDNTLLHGDSDHLWGKFLCDKGVVDKQKYGEENDRFFAEYQAGTLDICLLYTSPSPRDATLSRMPSSA